MRSRAPRNGGASTEHSAAPVSAYFDYNSTTPVDERVLDRMMPFFTRDFGNPASDGHAFGWDAQDAVEDARAEVAELVRVDPADIIFTSGATESINLAIKGIAGRTRGKGDHIVTARSEHPCVLAICKRLEGCGYRITYLPVDSRGRVDLQELDDTLTTRTLLVALMAANNETGTVHPVGKMAEICHAHGVLFLTDATQAVGKLPVNFSTDGVDLAAFSAHKIYGPKGVGALFVRDRRSGPALEPQMDGGGHEHGMRSGTSNVSGIVGFGEASRLARSVLPSEPDFVARLRDRFERELLDAVEDVVVNGDRAHRLPNTSNVTIRGVDARALIRDMHTVAVSTRSACASTEVGPSHVLKAMGSSDEAAYSSLRVSLGRFTTDREIDYLVGKLGGSIGKLRSGR